MTSKYKLRGVDLEWVESSHETVILDETSEKYLAANPAGSLLWNALSEGATIDEMASSLVERYEIDVERATADVKAFVSKLMERDLIEVVT